MALAAFNSCSSPGRPDRSRNMIGIINKVNRAGFHPGEY